MHTIKVKEKDGDRTAEVIRRFNEAFIIHDSSLLNDLVAENCEMEAAMPAPDGMRIKGRKVCLDFWEDMIKAPNTQFSPEEVVVMGEKAIITWQYHWGEGKDKSIKGCTIMTVKDGLITEAVGYVKGTLAS